MCYNKKCKHFENSIYLLTQGQLSLIRAYNMGIHTTTHYRRKFTMNEKLTKMLNSLSESRTQKYSAEIERQKAAIEKALFDCLESRKASIDAKEHAAIDYQKKGEIRFEFDLDAEVLPEVAEFISQEFNIESDRSNRRRVYAQYEF